MKKDSKEGGGRGWRWMEEEQDGGGWRRRGTEEE